MEANGTQVKVAELAQKVKIYESDFDMDDEENYREIENIARSFGPVVPIAKMEALVSFYKAKCKNITDKLIPDIMEEADLTELKLSDGTRVKIETSWNTTTKDCDSGLLAMWLEENGYGDLIKTSLEFGKGQLPENVVAELRERGMEFSRKSDVHASSLKAALKKHMEAGGELPPTEAVKVSIYNRAVVK